MIKDTRGRCKRISNNLNLWQQQGHQIMMNIRGLLKYEPHAANSIPQASTYQLYTSKANSNKVHPGTTKRWDGTLAIPLNEEIRERELNPTRCTMTPPLACAYYIVKDTSRAVQEWRYAITLDNYPLNAKRKFQIFQLPKVAPRKYKNRTLSTLSQPTYH